MRFPLVFEDVYSLKYARQACLTVACVKYTCLDVKNTVRHLREQLGFNQTPLAESCGVSRQSIHAVETNTFKPSVLLALKIAKVLNTEVAQLFILEKGD